MLKQRFMRILALALGACLATAAWAGQTGAPPTLPLLTAHYQIRTDRCGSQVNWVAGQLEVVGIGYAAGNGEMAKYQAMAVAQEVMQREAARALRELPVDGQVTLTAPQNDAMQALITSLPATLTPIDERWEAKSGRYTLVGALPLYGPHGVAVPALKVMNLTEPLTVKEDELALISKIPAGHTIQPFSAPYTGVIINADNVLLTPCLYPSLLRTDGQALWSPAVTTPDALINGQVRYTANLEAALQQHLAGARPLILTAIGTARGCHPVLDIDDVFLALSQQKAAQVLQLKPIVITLGR